MTGLVALACTYAARFNLRHRFERAEQCFVTRGPAVPPPNFSQ